MATDKLIKIVHITSVSQSLRYLMLNQLISLKNDGYEVVAISTPGPDAEVLAAEGIRYIPVHIDRKIAPLHDLWTLWQLWRIMRKERFVIVHTHNPKPGLLGQIAAKLAGVPLIVNTVHGFYFHHQMSPSKQKFFITLEKLAAKCSDAILSQNSEDIRLALDKRICSEAKISHLGNGIDLAVYNPNRFTSEDKRRKRSEIGLPEDSLVVGFVGRLAARRKGFLDFLKAGQQIAEAMPSVRFLIVGSGDSEGDDAVEPSRAKDFSIEDRCLFLGQQPNEALPLLYTLMDVLVLPSLFEGVPRAVMESSAMRVPAVVTDVKGNREVVKHNRNGLLVPFGDVDALAQAIISLLQDHDMAQRMGNAGREIAQDRFDEQLVFESVKATYRRLLNSKQGVNAPVKQTDQNIPHED